MTFMLKWLGHVSIIYLAGVCLAAAEPFRTAMLAGAALVPLAYLGDLFYMPRYGNFQTAFLEGLGAFGFLVLIQSHFSASVSVAWGMMAGLSILIFEIVLHRWILYQRTRAKA